MRPGRRGPGQPAGGRTVVVGSASDAVSHAVGIAAAVHSSKARRTGKARRFSKARRTGDAALRR